MNFFLRPMDDGDVNFVRASWMRAIGPSALGRWLGNTLADYTIVRDRCLSEGSVLIASIGSEHSSVCGWICTELDDRSVLHFLFVKERWRRLGVSKLLLDGVPKDATYTHRTEACRNIAQLSNMTYRPLRAFRSLPRTHAQQQLQSHGST